MPWSWSYNGANSSSCISNVSFFSIICSEAAEILQTLLIKKPWGVRADFAYERPSTNSQRRKWDSECIPFIMNVIKWLHAVNNFVFPCSSDWGQSSGNHDTNTPQSKAVPDNIHRNDKPKEESNVLPVPDDSVPNRSMSTQAEAAMQSPIMSDSTSLLTKE